MSWGKTRILLGAVAVCAATITSIAPAAARYWQCAPYAREISGVAIHGNANTWWGQAAGRYERGEKPEIGSVMAFKSHGKMRAGHVAMVSKIVSDREVRLTHANWSRGGQIERDVRAIDVSEAGDWSKVKVWYASMGDVGLTSYPIYGFIYARKSGVETAPARDTEVPEVRLASIAGLIDGLRQ